VTNWPLSIKLTAWSTLVVGLGVLACAIASLIYLRHEQVEALDDELARSARYLLKAWAASQDETGRHALLEACVNDGSTRRLLKFEDTAGTILFCSPGLQPVDLERLHKRGNTLMRLDGRYRVVQVAEGNYHVWLAGSLKEVQEDASERRLVVLPVLPVLILLALCGGWWIARKALLPIQTITGAAEKITAADLSQRLPGPKIKDDLGRLLIVLNGMFDRLEKSFGQAQRFSADASHELKTPLTVLRSGLEDFLDRGNLSPSQQRVVAGLLEQTTRLSRIVESLLLLSRADAAKLVLDLQPLDLVGLIQDCLEDAQILARKKAVALESRLSERLLATVDPGRFGQILMNLLENAVKYNGRGGLVRVTAERDPASGMVTITVGNTGPGIRPEDAPHVFERFFRGDPVSKMAGHGLGLSLARELARAHDGELTLVRTSPGWTEFRIHLPGLASSRKLCDRV
jgi:two-component system heavy metal sensor histidine kinase CusS